MAKGHGTMRRRRVVRAAVGLGVATMAWALAAGQVRAGPDKCTVSGSTATCQGNQSAGVKDGTDFPANTTTIQLQNLNTNVSPASGTPGVNHFPQPGSGIATIDVKFSGGGFAISTSGNAAHGILAGGQGHDGGSGSSGGAFDSGGTGGLGGELGGLGVTTNGTITTNGSGAHGIQAQALSGNAGGGGSSDCCNGGAGGEGGGGTTPTISGSGSITANGDQSAGINFTYRAGNGGNGGTGGALGSGGHGGGGGGGANFFLSNTGDWAIATHGPTNSPGVSVELVSGNGGSGGASDSAGFSGGSGGNGGSGLGTQPVFVGVSDVGAWTVTTAGTNSDGFFVSGQGGNGGNGGRSTTVSGGHGGSGGVGPIMFVFTGGHQRAAVTTLGDGSSGMHLLSVGGNGHNGGSSDTANGGNAGNGADGGTVQLGTSALVTQLQTSGDQAHGVFVVSQGGGGGNGGSPGIAGGGKNGDGGGGGGSLSILGSHTITTTGTQAHGIGAYSLGGPGGQGSDGSFFNPSAGGGGSTGASGPVDVNVGGTILTSGPESYGITAQSVAGHAGSGGSDVGVVGFGAAGGSAGAGGSVTVMSSAKITTISDQSVALTAQSIGGGGGSGGSGFGAFYGQGGTGSIGGGGATVTVTNTGDLTTSGDDAHGIYAQSIGGTGGDGGSSGALIALGGGATNTSSGGVVKVVNSGIIATGAATSGTVLTGPDPTCGTGCSHGIFAQSIGGGGGNGGSSGAWFPVGGTGGGGGSGGTVEVDNTNSISTTLASSNAIYAQSIGGGGGNGGGTGGAGVGFSVAIGGSGATGGAGNAVTVSSTAGVALATQGDASSGIVAQSIGGGGGNGGFAVDFATSPYGAATAAVGGSGEAGGGAGTVLVTTIASTGPQGGNSISTSGDKSFGIFAQSIGGGGGNGGFSVDVSAAPQGASLAVAVGGSGGGGGAGGQVTIMSDAAVTTQGYRSSGLYAHSIGGGGGDATFAAAGTVNLQDSGNLSVSVAGDGGAAGSAEKVVLQNSGTVQTTGDQAFGLDAQSIGGGGGNGGTSVSGTLLGEYDVGVAVGGQGSGGGNGAEVDLTNNAAITTLGDKAIGISAQSIGGSGGRGGLAIAGNIVFSNSKTLNLTLGGSGGAGGSAGAVSVTNTGAVTTGNPTPPPDPQDNAHAIFAQSVGGGGGHGGMAGSFTFGTNQSGGSAQVNVGIAVGGSGAAGNVGGAVDVTNSGALVTNAGQSHGIFAQSIGGGGGAGGAGYSASFDGLSAASSATYDIEFAIGGGGGTGNHAGPVTVGNQGSIETFAADSHGIYAHSVGGGGGSGGSAYTLAWNLLYATPSKTPPPKGKENYELQVRVGGSGGSGGDGDTVTITNAASIHTRGPDSHGILGYSVGGGGGDGGSASSIYGFPIPLTDRTPILQNVSISVGGSGASNGTGGEVDVTHTAGDITTEGQGSAGIYAQSVGAGGGTGGNGAAGATGTVGIGGTGGAAGDGGDVTVKFSGGSITTLGGQTPSTDPNKDLDSSYGIFAQSVGGGGGHAGNATFFGLPSSVPVAGQPLTGITVGIGLGIDLAGGNAGNGGTIEVDASGNITTQGPNAVGIFAQSVGGGGGVSGNLGFSPASEQALIGSVGGNGAGGAVDVTYTGSLTTAGGGAHGVFAQSVGGSGSGTVTVDVTGSVAASGSEAAGIFAQSVKLDSLATGTVGGDKINITLADGSQVQGGTPGVNNEAPGVLILDGTDNLLMTGASMLSNAKALAGDMSGYAIIATTGNDAVVNNGVILGSVDLGTGANTMNNDGSGILYSGTQLNVGAGNTFTNFGRLSPGGDEVLQTTALTGNLVQATGGNYLVTLDGAQVNVNDRVDVSGTADLAGTVQVQVIDAGTGTAPNQTTIIQSTGGVSAATAQNLTVQPSAVGNFGLVFSNPQTVDLTYAIDFSTPALAAGLNANQEAVADYLEALQGAGQIESEQLFLLEAEDTSAYAEALDQLSPEPYAVSSWAVALSAQQFSDALLSCREREGDARFIREGQCFRIGLQGRHFERDHSNDDIGYDIDAGEISLGGQKALSERWQLGAAVAYEYWRAEADDDIWRNSADQFQGGVVVKHQIRSTALSAALNGGFGNVDVRRDATPTATAKGDQDVAFVGGQLRAAHAIEFGTWYLKPRSDLSVAWVRTDGVDESGAGASNLDVEDDRQTYIALQPALEVGGEFTADDGYLLRPRASIGLTHFLKDPSPTAQARFATAPAGPAFAATSDVERTWLDLEVGVDVLSTRGINVGLSGFSQLADNAYHVGGALRLTIPF